MDDVSIIVTAHNNAGTLAGALQSVDAALAVFHRVPPPVAAPAEVVLVDDGSTDDTPNIARDFAAGRRGWKVVRRAEASSPACARNTGVANSRGAILFFLDADDLFRPEHVAACVRAIRGHDFVKTGVYLADPVHPGWRQRIEHSLVLNLCLRRGCHDAVGGFPDYHLCRREADRLCPEADIFYKKEDQFYNEAVTRLFRGVALHAETVEYRRHPGNSYDRQYEKFRRPPGEYPEAATEEERFRLRLAEVIFQERLSRLERQMAPGSAEVQFRLGQQLAQQGQREPALEHYRQAVQLRPNYAEAHSALGVALAEQGRVEEAVAHLCQATQLRPDLAGAHHNLGVALAQLGRPLEAIASLEQALKLAPDYAEACYNLAAVLADVGRRDDAIGHYRRAIELRPAYGEAYNNLGLALCEAGRHGEAAVVLQQAVLLRPQAVESHNNLGLAHAGLGRWAEAEACYRQALRLKPGYVEAHNNLASAFKDQGRLVEALAGYQVALWQDPRSASTRYNRSLALLQNGDYEEGWREYEYRWQRKQTPARPFRQPRWDASPLEGKAILLYSEQGLGDTIQFARYAALVKARGGRVVLECPGCLVPLFRSLAGVDEMVAEGQSLPAFDVQAPLLSLPGLLGTTLATVPAEVPYLSAVPARVEKWRGRLEAIGGFKVGVVWQGNPRHEWDRWRSVPLARFAPLAALPGVRLLSLQKGPGAEQVRGLKSRFEVVELGEEMDGEGGAFLDTAAVMKCLDLVVAADTAAAHLAGALGVPVWLPLAAVTDWRWMVGREDTPWYPTIRLFRQQELGKWGVVFEAMAAELVRQAVGAVRSRASGE
jgi:tetratricopeptide (TPR) repeat protein